MLDTKYIEILKIIKKEAPNGNFACAFCKIPRKKHGHFFAIRQKERNFHGSAICPTPHGPITGAFDPPIGKEWCLRMLLDRSTDRLLFRYDRAAMMPRGREDKTRDERDATGRRAALSARDLPK